MVSVERIQEYSIMAVEAAPVVAGVRPAEGWPTAGRVEFKDVVMR